VRLGRPRDDEIAGGGQKAVRIVVVERGAGHASAALATCDGRAVDHGARRIRRAVGPVSAGGEDDEPIRRRELQRRRHRELLAAPAAAVTTYGHRRLAAGNETGLRRCRAGLRDERARDVTRLPLQRTREDLGPIPKAARGGGGGFDDHRIVADDDARDTLEDGITWLRRLDELAARAGLQARA